MSKPTVPAKPLPELPLTRIPAILFEDDRTQPEVPGGPGRRFAVGPVPVEPLGDEPTSGGAPVEEDGERLRVRPAEPQEPLQLPGDYGTCRLWLAPRDPHCLYAHWDIAEDQLKRLEAESASGHLVLRIHEGQMGGAVRSESALAGGARTWFLELEMGGRVFVGELGLVDRGGVWKSIAVSDPVQTPAGVAVPEEMEEFATIPVDIPFAELLAKVEEVVQEQLPVACAIEQLRQLGFSDLPMPSEVATPEWTPAQERALAAVMRVESGKRVWVGSLDVTPWVREKLEVAPGVVGGAPGAGAPSSPAAGFGPEGAEAGAAPGISSPGEAPGRPGPRRGFWLSVNAELVIYGATEPDARLTVAGRVVRLRPDGSFALRFALPDGQYELAVEAVSAAGDDGRRARLEFGRQTEYAGTVQPHPQDPRLQPPQAEHVAASVSPP